MKNMSKILTLVAFGFVLATSNQVLAESNKVLNSKTFQKIRGDLWVYGPGHLTEMSPTVQGPQSSPSSQSHSKETPEELSKALQRVDTQRL